MEQEPEADSCFGTLLQALLTTFLLSYSLFSFFTSPQPTSNFVRLQMPRASLRQTLPLNFQLLSIIAQQQSTSTSLSLGLALSWPFMERFFGTAVLGRQAAACREPASLWDASRTGALHCAWDGWMDGRCGETLRLRAREEAVWDGLRRGLCRISPKAKSKIEKYFILPCRPEGTAWCYLLLGCSSEAYCQCYKSHASCQDCLSSWLHCPTATPIFAEICREAELCLRSQWAVACAPVPFFDD